MNRRRYHVVGVGVGFLVLGIVLGLVVGSSTAPDRMVAAVSGLTADRGDEVTALRSERDALAAQQTAADGFAERIGPAAVRGALPGKAVTIVSLGGDPADADAVAGLVGQAGGTVAGQVRLTDAVTDPARADQVRDLATRLLPAGAQLPASPDPGTVVGGLLGSALLSAPDGPTAAGAPSVLAGLTGAGLAEAGQAPGPAAMVVVLTGGAADGVDAATRAATAARLATEMDRRGAGAVLAGRGDGPATPVGAVRADPAPSGGLSTVDDVQTGGGRVATVLALQEQAAGRAGHYGSGQGATAPIPATQP